MSYQSACLKTFCISLFVIAVMPLCMKAQYAPISLTGFNHDVVAESGNSSLTTTTGPLDGVTVSNKVMYTQAFRTANGFGGGGVVDNGTITSGTDSYQLAAYTGNNALIIQRSQNADISFVTPAKYSALRVLAFSTEGANRVNATVYFTDGTQATGLTNYALNDWFNGTTNEVLRGFGRCTRATPASGADAYPNNPRMYYMPISLSCTDRQKDILKINFANVTTAGTNAPYPNLVILAISGTSYTQTIGSAITDATCIANGSVTLSITGSAGPYGVTWNTTPVQTGLTASNLPQGNYTATITDANTCTSTYPVTIGLNNTITMTAHADTSICYGASFKANTISNATGYSWSPVTGVSNPASDNPTLSPTATTTYTVTGTLGSCSINRSFTVTVADQITLNLHIDTTICLGASFNANTVSNASQFSWSPSTGVSDVTLASPVLSPASDITYNVTATTGVCSVSGSFNVAVVPGVTVDAGNAVTIIEGQTIQLNGSGTQGTYLWTPAAGLNAVIILNPKATPQVTTTYTLRITTAQGCTGTDDVIITVVPYCVKAMEAITPNGDGINDRWLVTNGNCIAYASVHVYNRYGSKVYENKDYRNDWEGTYKGKPVPDGTYYFVIEYRLLDGRDVFVKGSLTIIR